jgi:sugar lactone lactonase YvrE
MRDAALFWVDVVGRKIFRYKPDGGPAESRDLPFAPSAIIPRKDSGFLLVTKQGMALFDFDSGTLETIPVWQIDFSQEIFNDAACDRFGRLWVGTRDRNVAEPKGCLYRMEADFTMTRQSEGLTVSNGIAWSPDSKRMYHADSRPGSVFVYDYDLATGSIENRRVLIDYTAEAGAQGHPDGCTVDAEGGLWIAEVEGWRIARYSPEGELDRAIQMPFAKPTSVMFGGSRLETLFVTSMQFRLSEEELSEQTLAGRVLALDAGVQGLPEPAVGATANGGR